MRKSYAAPMCWIDNKLQKQSVESFACIEKLLFVFVEENHTSSAFVPKNVNAKQSRIGLLCFLSLRRSDSVAQVRASFKKLVYWVKPI